MSSIITIIIPVYNGGNFINSSYKSLHNQSFPNWEAIYIDDGSSDNTYDVISKICLQDKRVKVISKKNEGVAIARETGIEATSSNIITFLDVDDTLPSDAIESFVTAFEKNECDIVVGGINIISEQNRKLSTIRYDNALLTNNDAINSLCDGKIRWQLWGKAFKRHLFGRCVTPSGIRSAEDMAVCIQLFLNADKVCVLDQPCYNYLQVASSVTHSKAKEIAVDSLNALEFVENIRGNEISEENLWCLTALLISSSLRGGIDSDNERLKSLSKRKFNLRIRNYAAAPRIMRRIGIKKYLNVCIYKWFNLNLAKHL